MTCLASELTLKEGAPTVALEQVMATMQRLQAWRLICVLWFAFCENQTIEPRCPLHLNVVSTNVLHTYRNIIFLTSGPEAHRYKHSARFFLALVNQCVQQLIQLCPKGSRFMEKLPKNRNST